MMMATKNKKEDADQEYFTPDSIPENTVGSYVRLVQNMIFNLQCSQSLQYCSRHMRSKVVLYNRYKGPYDRLFDNNNNDYSNNNVCNNNNTVVSQQQQQSFTTNQRQ